MPEPLSRSQRSSQAPSDREASGAEREEDRAERDDEPLALDVGRVAQPKAVTLCRGLRSVSLMRSRIENIVKTQKCDTRDIDTI